MVEKLRAAGAIIIANANREQLDPSLKSLGLTAYAVASAPTVKSMRYVSFTGFSPLARIESSGSIDKVAPSSDFALAGLSTVHGDGLRRTSAWASA